MTTEKLIERARCCPQLNEIEPNWENCCNCPLMFEECKNSLVKELIKKLEIAYEELKDLNRCYDCGNSKCFVTRYDTEYCLNGEWEWEGDKE